MEWGLGKIDLGRPRCRVEATWTEPEHWKGEDFIGLEVTRLHPVPPSYCP